MPLFKPLKNDDLTEDGGRVEVLRVATKDFSHYPEGLSKGNPVSEVTDDVPYGCWFIRAPGSGVYVDVGRSLRTNTRQEVNKILDIKMPRDDDDAFWCQKALEKGYDSIQTGYSHGKFSEVVICNGLCGTEPLWEACPTIPMFDKEGEQCDCNNEKRILNCGYGGPKLNVSEMIDTVNTQIDELCMQDMSKCIETDLKFLP